MMSGPTLSVGPFFVWDLSMDRDLAEWIVKGVVDLSPPLGALGNLMAGTMDLLRPILRQYPDLDPDRDTD
jgi:hypothetical protein